MIPFLILLAFELARNYYVIERLRQTPNHARGWVLRAMVIAMVALIRYDADILAMVKYGLGCGLIEQGNPEKKKGNYIFEVFNANEKYTPKQTDDKIRQWVKVTNKWLKRYCALNELQEVSTYAARHTFASISKSHLSLAMISKMLGHSRVTTTQTYLGRFDHEENKTGLQKVFGAIKERQA